MSVAPPIITSDSKFKKRFPFVWVIMILVLMTGVFFVGSVVFIIIHSLPDTAMADAGFKKAKKTIDPELLRTWALEEIPKFPPSTNSFFAPKIPNTEVPIYMQKLYSEPVEDACVQHGDQPDVTISWGGPFFHWMFYIGSTNFVLPKDSETTIVQWVPGIYYSREDTVHPFK